jgi:DNA-binding protein H-NS
MKSVSSLSQSELNNLISEASRELEARKKSESVIRDIHKVLDKHGITKRERSVLLQAAMSGGMASTRTPKRASKRKGVKVAPKYRCPTSGDTWTGRGRAPAWVVDACKANKLSIAAFKSDGTYLI